MSKEISTKQGAALLLIATLIAGVFVAVSFYQLGKQWEIEGYDNNYPVAKRCLGNNFYEKEVFNYDYKVSEDKVKVTGNFNLAEDRTVSLEISDEIGVSLGSEEKMSIRLKKIKDDSALFVLDYEAGPSVCTGEGCSYSCEYLVRDESSAFCQEWKKEINRDFKMANYCQSSSDCKIIKLEGMSRDFNCYKYVNQNINEDDFLKNVGNYTDQCSERNEECFLYPEPICRSGFCVPEK